MDKEFTRQKLKELRAMVSETDRIAIVLQNDPDPDAITRASDALPDELAERVTYKLASATQIELEPNSFDLTVCSWSL